MDNTVYQEKHSLSGGVLLKWIMVRVFCCNLFSLSSVDLASK